VLLPINRCAGTSKNASKMRSRLVALDNFHLSSLLSSHFSPACSLAQSRRRSSLIDAMSSELRPSMSRDLARNVARVSIRGIVSSHVTRKKSEKRLSDLTTTIKTLYLYQRYTFIDRSSSHN
jgi:hypothetical protein